MHVINTDLQVEIKFSSEYSNNLGSNLEVGDDYPIASGNSLNELSA